VLRTNLIKFVCGLAPLLALSLAGCGLTQSVTEGTKSVFNSVFHKEIKRLHLDFIAREELNTDDRESRSLSEPVIVRVYQLKDRKTFDKTVYQQLLQEGDAILKEDLLASRDVVLKPGSDISLDMPMESDAQFVAIAALFRHPDTVTDSWKYVLARDELMSREYTTPSLYEMLTGNFTGGLELTQVSETNQVILSVLDNMQRILNCRAGTLAHLPDYGLPDMTGILQGMPGTAHQLIGTLSSVLLKYEPRLKRIEVILLEPTQPGELRYAIDAELKGLGLVRYGTEFMPEGKILLRHLKQQQLIKQNIF